MSWRDTLGVHAQNPQNTQKPTEQGNCADIADSAHRDSDPADAPDTVLTGAVEDLREHWNDRSAILEYDAGMDRPGAEAEAAVMTATLARNRGYPWRALRHALASRPDLAEQVPDTLDPVDRLVFGAPKLAILPNRQVIPQGRTQR